jgi:hypothetical protein
VVDNGASPRGQAAVQRVLQAYPQALLVHTPLQASGLNQGEIYFSLGPRTVLPPNAFASWTEGEPRLRLDEDLWNPRLRPCQGNVTREKLLQFLDRLEARPMAQRQALTTPETSRQVA